MNRNRHGAGIMYTGLDKRVHIAKGFNSAAEVMELVATIPEESPVVFHARIATHGAVIPANCHPFPIVLDDEGLRLTRLSCFAGFAHNGTFSEYSRASTTSGFPDSVEFMKDILVPIIHDIENQSVQFLLRRAVGWSKIAILTRNELLLFGDFIREGEVYYSNGTYKPYVAPVTRTYDDYDYGYWPRKKAKGSKKDKAALLLEDKSKSLSEYRAALIQYQYGLSESEAAALIEEGVLWD